MPPVGGMGGAVGAAQLEVKRVSEAREDSAAPAAVVVRLARVVLEAKRAREGRGRWGRSRCGWRRWWAALVGWAAGGMGGAGGAGGEGGLQ